jgi:DNA-binding NtrC family response regulator
MAKILIVDDDSGVRAAFEDVLTSQGHAVLLAADAESALHQLPEQPDVVVMDVYMPGASGLDALHHFTGERIPTILMTGRDSMDVAIEAMKRGAFDYQIKPFEPAAMLESIARALTAKRCPSVSDEPLASIDPEPTIIGHSRAMREVYKNIGRVAPTDATVLIRGASGTGKELVAREIHRHSPRCSSPFLAVNCVAIPETLLEGELFGYERGAFTGATSRRVGRFEQGHGGTIFLDEIGDMSLAIQAKLLRVLQERNFERIGGTELIHVDMRVIAATNRPLERAIAERTFREDLYHRLNVVTVSLPLLRDRQEDIPELTQYFLQRYSRQLGVATAGISDEALKALSEYPWPGNVRELEHCVYRALIFTRGYALQAQDVVRALDDCVSSAGELDEELLRAAVRYYLAVNPRQCGFQSFVERVERALVEEALRLTAGSRTKAAALLGLSRPNLHAKMVKCGCGFPRQGS